MNLTEAKKRNSFNHRKKASSATCDYRTEKRAIIRELYLSWDPRAWNLQHRHRDCVNKLMCEIQRFSIFPQNDWKRHLNSLLFLIIKKHFACDFFGEKKLIYQRGKDVFVLKVNTYQIHKFTNRRSVVIVAKPSVITIVVNISSSDLQLESLKWVRIPCSFIPKLVLYIWRPFG